MPEAAEIRELQEVQNRRAKHEPRAIIAITINRVAGFTK